MNGTAEAQPETKRQRVDLSPEETRAALDTICWRFQLIEEPWCDRHGMPYRWLLPHILFRGEWWAVGRTDLKDDIGTFCAEPAPDPVDPLGRFRDGQVLGARLRSSGGRRVFSVIDAYTDG